MAEATSTQSRRTVSFTSSTAASGKAPLFRRPNDYRAFLDVLAEGLERHPVRLISLLRDVQPLAPGRWVQSDPSRLSKLMHWVTATHAVRWHHHRNTVGQGPSIRVGSSPIPIEAAGAIWCASAATSSGTPSAPASSSARRTGRGAAWPIGCAPRATLPLVTTPFLASDAWIEYVNAPQTGREELRRDLSPKRAESVENRSDPL